MYQSRLLRRQLRTTAIFEGVRTHTRHVGVSVHPAWQALLIPLIRLTYALSSRRAAQEFRHPQSGNALLCDPFGYANVFFNSPRIAQ